MKKSASYAGLGLVLGAGVGTAVGALTHNVILGMAGPGIGLVLGMALSAKAKGEKPES